MPSDFDPIDDPYWESDDGGYDACYYDYGNGKTTMKTMGMIAQMRAMNKTSPERGVPRRSVVMMMSLPMLEGEYFLSYFSPPRIILSSSPVNNTTLYTQKEKRREA